jgi:hypothetical protein
LQLAFALALQAFDRLAVSLGLVDKYAVTGGLCLPAARHVVSSIALNKLRNYVHGNAFVLPSGQEPE